MSDLDQPATKALSELSAEADSLSALIERLREASGPDERFGITITESFVRDGMGWHSGKVPDLYVMRWRFHAIHETGTGQCVACGGNPTQVMERFETWLAANPDRNDPEKMVQF